MKLTIGVKSIKAAQCLSQTAGFLTTLYIMRCLVFLPVLPAVLFASTSNAAPQASRRSTPTVTLDNGSFVGVNDILTGTNKFLGIPFAQPPSVFSDQSYSRMRLNFFELN